MNMHVSSYKIYSRSQSKLGTVQRMTSTNNARPSLLAHDRDGLNQSERVAAKLSLVAFKWLNPLIPANYRPINASNVAQSIVSTLQTAGAGQHVLLSGDMQT